LFIDKEENDLDAGRIVLIVMSVIFGLSGFISFYISYRQYKERGFIFTNTWLFASQKERDEMDSRVKKAEYRFARNVFFMLGIIMSIFVVYFQLWLSWVSYIAFGLMWLLILYAIFQWIENTRLFKKIEDEKRNNSMK